MNEQKAFMKRTNTIKMRDYLFMKRIVDIFLSMIAMIFLSPIFICIGVLIFIFDRGPIIFKQTRTGRKGKPFTIYKFRTMAASTPTYSYIENWHEGVPDDFVFKSNQPQNVSLLGKFLRKSSLDELPQLWNVLKGEMSIVGPRPEIEQITIYYNESQRNRLTMKPGITGYAQINGRSNITHGEKIVHDVYYIDHCSLKLDMQIMFATVLKLIYTNDNY